MDGAILIDKEPGVTSAQVVSNLKRKFSLKRVGHCGTLDPMATGLLVILCGKATKFQQYLMDGSKQYSGIIQLGLATSTDDIEGEIIGEHQELDFLSNADDTIGKIKKEFVGTIDQVPPKVSAIKVNGKESYKRVRKGETVELKSRSVVIEELELSFISNTELEYSIKCSKGTYVRSLARDIGTLLGTYGCLKSIRRTLSSPFKITDSVSLDEVDNLSEHLIPISNFMQDYPFVIFSNKQIDDVREGRQEVLRDINLADVALARILDERGELISIVEKIDQQWKIRLVASRGTG